MLLMLCSWFDLDQHEVLDLKARLLEAAGASKMHGDSVKYPLHASSYVSAVVDLNSPAWPDKLIQAGQASMRLKVATVAVTAFLASMAFALIT